MSATLLSENRSFTPSLFRSLKDSLKMTISILGLGEAGSYFANDLAAVGVTEIRSYSRLAAEEALPDWLFDSDLQRSHQSALVRKDPGHYGPLFPGVPDDLPYYWPPGTLVG